MGNFPTLFHALSHSADCFVIDLCSVGNLPIALGRVSLQQFSDYLTTLLSGEVTTMDVGADDVVSGSSSIASEVRKLRRNLRILASTIAIVAVEDFTLVEDYRVMQAMKLDITRELVEVLGQDLRKQLRQGMRF